MDTRVDDLFDWECFLLPVELFVGLDRLPVHEAVCEQLVRIRVPEGRRVPAAVREELARRRVCAVSWRWSDVRPAEATIDRLRDWSPMSVHQLGRLKDLVAKTTCRHVWVDWTCIPQLDGETMRFINASYGIYAGAEQVVVVSRMKALARRGWPSLSALDAKAVVEVVRTSADNVVAFAAFSETFATVIAQHDEHRVRRMERELREYESGRGLEAQVDSATESLERLLRGDEIVYPTFEYFARAWTLAERLAAYDPSSGALTRLGRLHMAGDALLYGMAGFWRDAGQHNSANAIEGRQSVSDSDLIASVWRRGVDEADDDVHALWDDVNSAVQLAPGIRGVASEGAALAVICVEWLLHRGIGLSDALGRRVATLLGECVAFTAGAVHFAPIVEEASVEWFRKYLYFYAGGLYGASVRDDLILAVYRGCGLPERDTAAEAIALCLDRVFDTASGGSLGAEAAPEVAVICREAVRHRDVHAHLLSRGDADRGLRAVDFVPMFPRVSVTGPIDAATWHEWLAQSGVITSWWWSTLQQTVPVDPDGYFDIEHLFCDAVERLEGLSFDHVLASAAAVVYKVHRLSATAWRIVQISVSRDGGRAGDGLNYWRSQRALDLEGLLRRDISGTGRTNAAMVQAWNKRCLASLHEAVHAHWDQCSVGHDVVIVS